MVLLFEVDHFLRCQPRAIQGSAHEVLVNGRQAVGVFVRKRPEQNIIDNTEDYSGRADSQRQCDNCSESEATVFPQPSEGKPNVMYQVVHLVRLNALSGTPGVGRSSWATL